jgi:hypothetical protein
VLFGNSTPVQSGSDGKVTVTVPAVGALLLEAESQIPVSAPPTPQVKVAHDLYTRFFAVKASVSGSQPVTVAFAVKRAGSSTWRRLDVDDSSPYRAFLDPVKFKKGEKLQLVAIARNLSGATARSAVVTYQMPG